MYVLYNAQIHTLDPANPTATAIAVDHGRVALVGSDSDVLAALSSSVKKQDMHGQTIWPGLTDAHIHLQHYAFALHMIDCETPTQAECLRRVEEKVRKVPAGEWVRGHGWNQNDWPEGFGTVQALDALAPAHPVYLTAKSLHAAWASSTALREAGITLATPDPQGGKIGRDETGEPNGLLFESAMGLVEAAIPAPGAKMVAQAVGAAQNNLWQAGITAVHDYDGAVCFTALQLLQAEGRLRIRVVKGIPLENLEHAIALGLRTGFGNDFLRTGPVKLFADGALGPQTAAMLQPYEGALPGSGAQGSGAQGSGAQGSGGPGDGEKPNSGILLLDNEQIFEHGQKATANGISMAIHAIGDRANHEVLLGYAQLRRFEREHGLPALRHRIEHVQVLHPEDYGRLAELDVIASVQPIHATSDMHMADRHWGSRSAGAYAFRTLIEHGTRVCFGSDAPVKSPNPFLGLHAAVTRQRADGTPGKDGWYPSQRLALADALQGFTSGAAYAAGLENQQGRLAQGYYADLIVLAQNPFTMPVEDLQKMRPSATMVGGEWVWQAE